MKADQALVWRQLHVPIQTSPVIYPLQEKQRKHFPDLKQFLKYMTFVQVEVQQEFTRGLAISQITMCLFESQNLLRLKCLHVSLNSS